MLLRSCDLEFCRCQLYKETETVCCARNTSAAPTFESHSMIAHEQRSEAGNHESTTVTRLTSFTPGKLGTPSLQCAAAELRDIDQLRCRIDVSKLCSRASMIRQGIPCIVDLSNKQLTAMMGNQNCHAEITFEVDVVWIVRFRITETTSPPQEGHDFNIRSEAAMMSYLCQHTSLPVPRIFDWSYESDPENTLGVSYILMEKNDGRPLGWWAATPAQREKVMQQMADIFLEIERHTFDSMGLLVASPRDPAHVEVQGLAQHATYQLEAVHGLGPFSSPADGSAAIIEAYLAMIASGEIVASRRIAAYLTHRFRLDIINRLWTEATAESRFILRHPDDKGDHILVNDDFDIVGIIDWEWTRTVSRAEAFCSPLMMWPVAKFYAGSNELAPEELQLAKFFRERGREDPSEHILTGRKVQRFFFALGSESPSLTSNFTSVFAGLTRAFDHKDEAWEQWRNDALDRWRDDDQLRKLVQQQDREKETSYCGSPHCPELCIHGHPASSRMPLITLGSAATWI